MKLEKGDKPGRVYIIIEGQTVQRTLIAFNPDDFWEEVRLQNFFGRLENMGGIPTGELISINSEFGALLVVWNRLPMEMGAFRTIRLAWEYTAGWTREVHHFRWNGNHSEFLFADNQTLSKVDD